MKAFHRLSAVALLSALAACAPRLSPEEIAARQTAQNQEDTATCASMGAAKGTDAFTACRLKLVELRAMQERDESTRNELRRLSMSQTLDSMAQNIRPTYQPSVRDSSFSCRSNTLFGTTTTNCSPY
jgi:erythromycin esterase-like protein